VEREDLSHAPRRHALGKKRVVGRVIDRVRESQDSEHRDEDPIRIGETREGNRGGAQQESAYQVDARSGAVDEEADRRLQRR